MEEVVTRRIARTKDSLCVDESTSAKVPRMEAILYADGLTHRYHPRSGVFLYAGESTPGQGSHMQEAPCVDNLIIYFRT